MSAFGPNSCLENFVYTMTAILDTCGLNIENYLLHIESFFFRVIYN